MSGSHLSKSSTLVGAGDGRGGLEGVLLSCKGSTCDSMETFSGGSSETISNPFLFPQFGTWPITTSKVKDEEGFNEEANSRPDEISSVLAQMSKDGEIYHRHVKEVLPMLRLRKRHYQIKYRTPRDTTSQQLKRGLGGNSDRDLIKRQVLKVLRL